MKEKVLQFIRANPRTSFNELEKFFLDCGFDYRGTCTIDLRRGSNIVLWEGWNAEAVDILMQLVLERKINIVRASKVEMMLFGKALLFQIVKVPKHDYKRRHWLPVVLIGVRR